MATSSPAELFAEGIERAGFTPVPVTVEVPAPSRRATVTVTVDHPDAARARVLKLEDPSGATTFHLPVPDHGERRIEPRAVFHIPASRLAPFTVPGERGLLPNAPTPTLLADDAGDRVGDEFVAWYRAKENHDHPYGIRHVVTQDGRFAPGDDVTDWSEFDGRTVLLFVHGVLSSSQNCFHGLRADLVDSLSARYPVICFDHPTVSIDPRDNVRWFLQQIPPDIDVTFRIIAHSRGGIIARILAGGLGEISMPSGITVETIAMAGTPNLGTPIVSVSKWSALVDRLANLAAFLPGPFHAPGEFIGDVLRLLTAAAADAIPQLPGLAFMLDKQTSGVLFDLDAAPDTTNTFYAVDTEFRPEEVLWHIFDLHRDLDDAAEVLVDHAVFDRTPNDIAVPTSGVRGSGLTGGGFPIADGLSFGVSGTVWHCSYFDDEATWRSLRAWFLDSAVG